MMVKKPEMRFKPSCQISEFHDIIIPKLLELETMLAKFISENETQIKNEPESIHRTVFRLHTFNLRIVLSEIRTEMTLLYLLAHLEERIVKLETRKGISPSKLAKQVGETLLKTISETNERVKKMQELKEEMPYVY